jgi:hypothetical protein
VPGRIVAGADPAPTRPSGTDDAAPYLEYDVFADWGVRALTTTRIAGSFGTASDEPVAQVTRRWDALQAHAAVSPAPRVRPTRCRTSPRCAWS